MSNSTLHAALRELYIALGSLMVALAHPTTSPVPALNELDVALAKLRQVLEAPAHVLAEAPSNLFAKKQGFLKVRDLIQRNKLPEALKTLEELCPEAHGPTIFKRDLEEIKQNEMYQGESLSHKRSNLALRILEFMERELK